ncbi:MAG: (Fe-S)-binding protein [Anaerolineae bacterium]|jgi:Fe-S oxidoreductase
MLTKFIETMRGRISRPLQYYEDICVRCGACADACHFYAASKDPAHIPAQRMMLVKKAIQLGADSKRGLRDWYHDFQGTDPAFASQLEKAMWDCTGCRRCAVFCPFDLDTGLLVGSGRYAMLQEEIGPEMIAEIGDAEVSKGEIVDFIKEFFVEQTQELEARLQDEFHPDLRIPVEEKGAEYLYVPLVGEHAIIPAAKIFHAAGQTWTLSLFTATNHSYFVGDAAKAKAAANWIVQEARNLGVKGIVYPECGHASRTLFNYFEGWFGDEIADIERLNIVPLTHQYLAEGRIQVKPKLFDTPLTYHDSCSLGRSSGMYEEPRELIHTVATDYREMTPNRELNWCCGGGGGLIAAAEDKFERRMQGGIPKVDQIRQTGAKWVITACENCKTQLEDLNDYYKVGYEIKGVIDLIADALIV